MKVIGPWNTRRSVSSALSSATSYPYVFGMLPIALVPTHSSVTCSPVLPSVRICMFSPCVIAVSRSR